MTGTAAGGRQSFGSEESNIGTAGPELLQIEKQIRHGQPPAGISVVEGWLCRKGGRKEGEELPRKKNREHSGKGGGGDTA